MIVLASRDVPHVDLDRALGALSWPEGAYCWVRWTMGARLSRPDRLDRNLGESLQGRFFGEGGEIRWQRLSEATRIVFLGEDAPALDGFEQADFDLDVVGERDLVLAHEESWDEGALPNWKKGQIAVMRRREYRSASQGHFARFLGVAVREEKALAAKGEEKANALR